MDSNNIIQMASGWLLSLGCLSVNFFFLLADTSLLAIFDRNKPRPEPRKILGIAFFLIMTVYCSLNVVFLASRSLQSPDHRAVLNFLSAVPFLSLLFFYKALESYSHERFFSPFAIMQLVILMLVPVLRLLPEDFNIAVNIFLFAWSLSVLGYGFYLFSRHVSRTASGNSLLPVLMVALVLCVLALVNDLSLSTFDFVMVPDYLQISGLSFLGFFLTALIIRETPEIFADDKTASDPRLDELKESVAALRRLYISAMDISGDAENSAERLFALINSTTRNTSESLGRIHSVDSQMKANIADIKTNLNGFIAEVSPVLEDHLKTEKSSKSVDDIANILEEIENKGKIISSGVINLTTIIDNAMKNTEKSHKIIIDIRTDLDNIDSFSQTIEKVSEEANTLAMNAAIESAGNVNAGTNGFKVVSEDLRSLSSKIKSQTEEINSVLSSLKKDLDAGIISTDSVKTFFQDIEMITENIFRLILDIVNHSSVISSTIAETRSNIESLHQLSEHLEKLFHDNRTLTEDMSREIEISRSNFYRIAALIGRGKEIFESLQEKTENTKKKSNDIYRFRDLAGKSLKELPETDKAD